MVRKRQVHGLVIDNSDVNVTAAALRRLSLPLHDRRMHLYSLRQPAGRALQ